MEEFFKTLDIKKIKNLYMDYIDNEGNYKKIEIYNNFNVTYEEE